LGKALPQELTVAGIADAFAVAVDAVKARGKSDAGEKTMLDVLVPLLQVLRSGADDLPKRLRVCASEAARATVSMKATRGRASFLGERSIGHMDPGARSSELITHAILNVLTTA
jgi:dihydroxyacetone kinase-like protein